MEYQSLHSIVDEIKNNWRGFIKHKVCYRWKSWYGNTDFGVHVVPEINILLHVAKQSELLYRCIIMGGLCFIISLTSSKPCHELGRRKLKECAVS